MLCCVFCIGQNMMLLCKFLMSYKLWEILALQQVDVGGISTNRFSKDDISGAHKSSQ